MNPDDEATLVTRVAHAGWGDNRYRGYSVTRALAGRDGLWSMASLAVGHRRLLPDEAALLDDVSTCSFAGDPRIWPLKVVRLAGSFGSVAAAMCAGHLATDGGIIGPAVTEPAAAFLVSVSQAIGRGASTEAAVNDCIRSVLPPPGFGVPFRDRDERVDALAACLARRGADTGRYWRLLSEIQPVVARLRKAPVNIAGAVAAALLDLGFSPEQLAALPVAIVNFIANAYEAAEQRSPIMQQLPRDHVQYVGPPPRQSPRERGEE
jgi:hypothetical protein